MINYIKYETNLLNNKIMCLQPTQQATLCTYFKYQYEVVYA